MCGGKLDTDFVCIECGGRYPPTWVEKEERGKEELK